jgi:hypothetical protein
MKDNQKVLPEELIKVALCTPTNYITICRFEALNKSLRTTDLNIY